MTGDRGLQAIAGFGSNPGALRAWSHVPPGLPPGRPLVVALHGCTQSAADYDRGAGWSQLADELGFAVLLAEQRRANNPNRCFNWFSRADSRRDSGEALSISQMIGWMAQMHAIDPQRIFVTGLSAGGAMTSIMLATYPELFAGGAIIAGLPYGPVASVGDAFARMAGQGYPAAAELEALVRAASTYDGPWPRISVWHGSADTTVAPGNAGRIVAQWAPLLGVDAAAFDQDESGHHLRRTWRDRSARIVLEQNIIAGMGHGTALKTFGADGCGRPGPYMLEAGVSSTRAIARFWGLDDAPVAAAIPVEPAGTGFATAPVARPVLGALHKGVGAVIEEALRAAGLMK